MCDDCHDPTCSTAELSYARRKRLEREDPGCQARRKIIYSPDAVTAGWIVGYCPACYDGKCADKRPALRHKVRGEDARNEGSRAWCATCRMRRPVRRLYRCRCCDRWFFVCGACRARARNRELVMAGPGWCRVLAPAWFDRLWRRLTGGCRG